jgi:hypothetical protein
LSTQTTNSTKELKSKLTIGNPYLSKKYTLFCLFRILAHTTVATTLIVEKLSSLHHSPRIFTLYLHPFLNVPSPTYEMEKYDIYRERERERERELFVHVFLRNYHPQRRKKR